MTKYVYTFAEGNANMRTLLGGKGANLAEMTRIELPVPPGIIVTTEACLDFYQEEGGKFPEGLEEQIRQGIKYLEQAMDKKFGDANDPLLVSVRSGAPVSMPGMMDTILNLGLTDVSVQGLAEKTENERFAYDCYRRFIQMFGDVAMSIPGEKFEDALAELKNAKGVVLDTDLTADHLKELIQEFKAIYREHVGEDFPQDPYSQLLSAVHAVFASWNNERAKVYRRLNKISDDLGTAVNIQVMVYGNMGPTSGTGVAFTRNPATGENALYGEYLINAQGEDVVAGIRTPEPIDHLKEEFPNIYDEFHRVAKLLEDHYHDLQDIEFTVQEGKLYILQTRSGKRTAAAAIKVAVDLVREGKISKQEALLRVDPAQLVQLMHRRIDPEAKIEIVATGLPASPGAATGKVVFTADEAEARGNDGENVILVRTETTPDDIHGLVSARGVLTSRGGMTSHAAVVARGMGKPAVCGCEGIKIDAESELFVVGNETVKKDDVITIDGATGHVILGVAPMIEPELTGDFETILDWADEVRTLDVRANADYPRDANQARQFGANGIGLCRTEHMFMEPSRLPIVQEMILAGTPEGRRESLAKLLSIQEEDFYGILKAMAGYPVTIRLLDPPLHEFLPKVEELLVKITELRITKKDPERLSQLQELLRKVRALAEFNPMLGHRGCRLGVTFPDVYEMQAQAIFNAVSRLVKEGVEVYPEIMIPLVGIPAELELLREIVVQVAEKTKEREGVQFEYKVGTMIELPRACLVADKIAQHADFFSFGTNDLTQTTFGFSRDDAEGKFLPAYIEKKILQENPFAVLDEEGMGQLIALAVEKGRSVRNDLHVGICGEHGGDPESIDFCHRTGFDYVSCSPFRVPVARLAAARAELLNRNK
ncbi:MAG TPA: pyruvate, phosphate dikinase [Firmicutes bacterium]|jgi:pyruvate,orthophosphate dikinase|nr:pyruvate, phosphate dikinase [Bacillota bacterium]